MNRIKILSDNVKKKISAGEVIEGPFSVIKELIENSIDAGADRIDIQVYEMGLKKILVRDNGTGIHKDDVKLSILEHATSKIEDVYDIDKIDSYGFRGEALSSISSISKLTILTKTQDEDIGTRLVSYDEDVQISENAGSTGTTIIVENLFYNTPARKKFLKAQRTEKKYIRDVVTRIALARPEISFSLEVDDKRQVTLTKTDNHEVRVGQVFGNEAAGKLCYEKLQDLKVEVHGFLSKPDFMKSTRSMQYLYINKRPVEIKYFGFILSRAYEAVAQRGQYPAAIIFIDIDPTLIDVNIHPAKREVKLFDQKYIESMIFHLAEKVLNNKHELNESLFTSTVEESSSNPNKENLQNLQNYNNYQKSYDKSSAFRIPVQGKSAQQEEVYSSPAFIKEVSELYNEMQPIEQDIRILGVAFETYIIYEHANSLNFLDFHAAHERKIYDLIIDENSKFEKQDLMFPIIMELSVNDFQLLLDNIDEFRKIGFDIEEFSDNSINIRSVPEIAKNVDAEIVFKDFIESLKNESVNEFDIQKKVAATVACHSARRSGDKIDFDEMKTLINDAINNNYELRCPHGRPFVYKIEKSNFERMFKRQ